MELLVGERLGKYEVLGRIASGGMAEVYLARSLGHGGFSKLVALKRMLPELTSDPSFVAMFMQEAAVAARLNHPHVVQIFDFAEEAGELYLAMEFVHGVTLRQMQKDALAQPASARLRIHPLLAAHVARGVARALAYAWQVPDERGDPSHLIHRDVSPHNILLSYEGDAKLADFGIARSADRSTSVGMLKGKLLYMPPEQLLGEPLDARCDVFALGIVLYESALNLRKPLFDSGGEEGVKKAVAGRLVVPPERMDPDFPRGLSKVIMKALERDREKRFASASELADALGEVIHREAKAPQDSDLAAFMRKLYGEPQPIKGAARAPQEGGGARTPPTPSVPGSSGDDDPGAKTLSGVEGPSSVSGERPPTSSATPVVAPTPSRPLRLALAAFVATSLLAMGGYGLARAVLPRSWTRGISALAFAGTNSSVEDSTARPSGAGALPSRVDGGPPAAGPPVGAEAGAEAEQRHPEDEQMLPEDAPTGWVVLSVKPWGFAWLDDEPYTGSSLQTAQPALRRRTSVGRHVMHWGRAGCGFYAKEIEVPASRDGLFEVRLETTPTCAK